MQGPAVLTWGATEVEASARLPGDDLPGSLVMEGKMLRGIKQRAETLVRTATPR